MSMKNSNDTIGTRTRDRPVCSVVPQPTEPPPPFRSVVGIHCVMTWTGLCGSRCGSLKSFRGQGN